MKNQIKEKLGEYLKGTGWDEELKYYWASSEFDNSIETLCQMVKEKKLFTPSIKEMFRFLKECPFSTIKTVIFIDDPCNDFIHSGIPFSQKTENMGKPDFPKHENHRVNHRDDIKMFLGELASKPEFNFDLTRWCHQGVFMFPYTPSCRLEGNPHFELWRELRIRILDLLNVKYPNIPWVLTGERTIKMEDNIDSRYIIVVPKWKKQSYHWYDKINEYLKNNKKKPIKWN